MSFVSTDPHIPSMEPETHAPADACNPIFFATVDAGGEKPPMMSVRVTKQTWCASAIPPATVRNDRGTGPMRTFLAFIFIVGNNPLGQRARRNAEKREGPKSQNKQLHPSARRTHRTGDDGRFKFPKFERSWNADRGRGSQYSQ
jgi:hypothetical protein